MSVGFVYKSVEIVPSSVRVTKTSKKLMDLKGICVCELNGLVDRIDACEKVLKLIRTLIPYHENVIYVAKPNGWLNMILV